MYNAVLNGICLQELKEHVAGKKVCLVGNSATIFSDKHHGELIDSFDVVLRFGKGVPYTKYSSYLGTKKDIWFFGSARAGMWHHFNTSKFRVLTMSQINLYKEDEQSLLLNKRMFDGSIQIYRDCMLTGNSQYMYKMVKDIHGTSSTLRSRLNRPFIWLDLISLRMSSSTLMTCQLAAGSRRSM
jgi:hypothetical protein